MYGLAGKKLSHSFSKSLFEAKFGKKYPFRLIESENISGILLKVRNIPELKGFNVTRPFKQSILQYLDNIDNLAASIGAVNTVKVTGAGNERKMHGYNTDVYGFKEAYKNQIKQLKNCTALILGTGGAALAVAAALEEMKIGFLFVSRKIKDERTISYDKLTGDIIRSHNLIINATPLGMFPTKDEFPQICFSAINAGHLVIDLIYNPPATMFLKKSESQGATLINGLEMLKKQALKSWQIWGLI